MEEKDAERVVGARGADECSLCGLDNRDCWCGEDEGDDGGHCHWCGGDGWRECNDPIECTSPHNRWGECQCSSCGGSGDAKDMTIW